MGPGHGCSCSRFGGGDIIALCHRSCFRFLRRWRVWGRMRLKPGDLGEETMTEDPMYHDGMRQLQDARETRPLADRLEKVTLRRAFTDEDRAFIHRCPMFFIATADAHGHPDCSYKGGLPGFVRVIDDRTLAIPDYDGNGMYRTWGNVLVNPHVGLMFLDFEQPKRLRVNGTAELRKDDPLLGEYPGA